MAKENLNELVRKEFEGLMTEKSEIEKKIAPLKAFLDVLEKGQKTGEKRGRKTKEVAENDKQV